MTSFAAPPGLFVTGTDTGVGKTQIAVLIAEQLRSEGVQVGVYKPVCSGASSDQAGRIWWDDICRLRDAVRGIWTDDELSDDVVCPQRFLAPLAPPLAARAEHRAVDIPLLRTGADRWNGRSEFLIVEGAGGFLTPLSETTNVADLACDFRYPLIVVARCGLGTINHSLLTIEAARRRGLQIAGVVLNQPHLSDNLELSSDNAAEIESRGDVPVIGVVSWNCVDIRRHGRTIRIAWQTLTTKCSRG